METRAVEYMAAPPVEYAAPAPIVETVVGAPVYLPTITSEEFASRGFTTVATTGAVATATGAVATTMTKPTTKKTKMGCC
mmetsp:Transcript_18334/g.33695  ORF Transcript_18334/g.33695 Transcript_18334/m.33695 type:complete len:80 (-) Transcript_18334:287-526(-)